MKLFGELKSTACKYRVQIIAVIVPLLLVLSGLGIWNVVTLFSSPHFSTAKQSHVIFHDYNFMPNWFNQTVDHFNSNDNRTFKQRYWLNDRYYTGNGIQFLYIGGQRKVSFDEINFEKIPIVAWAKNMDARLFILEHRYYGQSHPTEDMSVENLKYLSSRQALEDIARFIRTINEELEIKNPKWVVFGGSYSGMLALWFRDKYPELTIGALGSSAPLELVIDYPAYYQTVQDVYQNFDPNCSNAFREVFQRIDNLLETTEGRLELNNLLDLDSPLPKHHKLSKKEMDTLFLCFSRGITTQDSTLIQIKNVCKAMMDERITEPVTRLTNAIEANRINGKFYYNYTEKIGKLQNISFYSEYARYRVIIWQHCNEQGIFTSLSRNSFFGRDVSVDYFYDRCMDVFGKEINATYVQNGIKKAIEFYGTAEEYNATNVVLTNGNLDPWHPLGIHESKNPSMITIMIEGVSHCIDIVRFVDSRYSIDLKYAQHVIFNTLQKWTSVSATVK